MKNNNLIIGAVVIGVIILAIGGLVIYNQSSSGADSSAQKNEEVASADNDSMVSANGRYIAYTPAIFTEKEGTDRVLYFYANWCTSCRPADKSILENSENLPEGLNVIRINYNDSDTDQDEKDLAKEYSITYQHTYVQLDKEGNEITRWSGGGFEEILENVK